MNLKDKIVAITGGGSGIGLAVAKTFAAQGCRVVIGGRRELVLQQVAESCQTDPAIRYHKLDVADRDSVDTFFAWVTRELGQVDILVNSAGGNIADRTMSAMKPDEWDLVLKINVTGAYNCIHAVLPAMQEENDGLIINISSVAGKRAIALGGVAYNASKFAMTALGISVSNEVAPDGIRVTNVYPGEVNTPILDKRPVPVSDEHRRSILQPEDISRLVLTIAQLPPRAHVPEIVIKPLKQMYA